MSIPTKVALLGGLALVLVLLGNMAHAGGWKPSSIQQQVVDMPRENTRMLLAMSAENSGYSCDSPGSYRRLGFIRENGDLVYLIECQPWDTYMISIRRSGNEPMLVTSCRLMGKAGLPCESLPDQSFQAW